MLRTIHLLIVLLCAGLSGVFSYGGFLKTFGEMAIAFAAVITLCLVFANIRISRDRMAGRGILAGLFLFLIAASLSFISNFNFVYTKRMQEDVAFETVTEAYETYRGNMITARAALARTSVVERSDSRRSQLERELDRLYQQVTDPVRRGVGERARTHIDNIYAMLGSPLTDRAMPAPGAPLEAIEQWYTDFRTAVMRDYERRAATTDEAEYRDILARIDHNLREYPNPPATATASDLAVLQVFSTNSEEVERRANALLPADDKIDLAAINSLDGRLGEIDFSLVNGFVEMPRPSTTALASVVAAAIDLVPLLFSIFGFRTPRRGEREDFHSGVRASAQAEKGLTG